MSEPIRTRVEGGILEGFGKLFPDNTRLLVYPELDQRAGGDSGQPPDSGPDGR